MISFWVHGRPRLDQEVVHSEPHLSLLIRDLLQTMTFKILACLRSRRFLDHLWSRTFWYYPVTKPSTFTLHPACWLGWRPEEFLERNVICRPPQNDLSFTFGSAPAEWLTTTLIAMSVDIHHGPSGQGSRQWERFKNRPVHSGYCGWKGQGPKRYNTCIPTLLPSFNGSHAVQNARK